MNDAWTNGLVGRVLCGRYETLAVLGTGGMGAVLRATHTGTKRAVAVKVMRPELARDADIVTRFHREARAAASVGCRGVVDVLDLDVDPEVGPILVLELLEGESLHARIARLRAIDPAETIRIASQVAETLRQVHANGIVHRDLKPANVMLVPDGAEEVAKLVDFGIARVAETRRTGAMTVPGLALGTPRYMSPEQAFGEPDVDARSDLYSLGAMMYFMLAGRPPYADVTGDEVLFAVHSGSPSPLTTLVPSVPPGLAAIVSRAMERDRKARYQSADELLAALRALDDVPETRVALSPATPVRSSVPGTRGRTAPTTRRRTSLPLVAMVLVLVALVIAGVTGAAWHFEVGPFAGADGAVEAERARATIAHARALLAAGDADRAGKELHAMLSRVESEGSEVDIPLGTMRSEAHVLLAEASIRSLARTGTCTERSAALEASLAAVREELAAASKGATPAACDLVALALAELEAGEELARTAARVTSDCGVAAHHAAEQALRHAAPGAPAECARRAADVRTRAEALASTVTSAGSGGGGSTSLTPLGP